MKNQALAKACRHVGGQVQLAEGIGKKQQHIWNWGNITKYGVPHPYVLPIEALTLVSRSELRPDIYPEDGSQKSAIATCTEDGSWLARDPVTGIVVSAPTLPEAIAELRRRIAVKVAA